MKSLDFKNIFIFVASAWVLGASLSCPDNINHDSSKNSNDQSRPSRLNKKISNDNNLARDISRNNNVAQGESIMGNNRGLNSDRITEKTEKLVNSWKEKRHYTTYVANFLTNKEPRSRQTSDRKLHVSTYSKTNEKEKNHTESNFKPKPTQNKFSQEIDEFPIYMNIFSRNDNLTIRKTERNQVTSKERPEIRQQLNASRNNSLNSLKRSNEFHQQYFEEHHQINRREATVKETNKTNNDTKQMLAVKIATVLPKNELHPFSIKRVRPAIEIAIEKMNPVIAHHNRYLSVKFRDSKCDIADGINECINFYVNKEMHVLFGPCCDYSVAPCARQVVYWNIPMITAGGLAGDFGLGKQSMYSTMTRVGSNFNTLVQFIVDILMYYNWRKINLVYDPFGQTKISRKLCHIAANDIHYGLREIHQSKNITQTYIKFEKPEKYPSNFQQQIGLDCAGKSM